MQGAQLFTRLVVALSVVASPALSERTDELTEYHKQTLGDSGVLCTPEAQRCISGASCVNQQCVCPSGETGNALIDCVPSGFVVCTIAGDPHMRTFGDGSVDIDLPCRFRAARFVTPHQTNTSHPDTCAFEVFATSEPVGGRYHIRSVYISLGMTDLVNQVVTKFEIRKARQYTVDDQQIYNYVTNVTARDSIWGSSAGTVEGLQVTPTFDDVDNFAVLNVPDCGTSIKYRAYDPTTPLHQRLVPGLSIQAPSDATFFGNVVSVCGSAGDSPDFYQTRATELGLPDAKTAVLYEILLDKPNQGENPFQDKCDSLFNTFETLPAKESSLSSCSFIVNNMAAAQCVRGHGMEPVDLLTDCLSVSAAYSASACQRISAAASACGSLAGWQESASVSCIQRGAATDDAQH